MRSILFFAALICFAEVAGSFNKANIPFRLFIYEFIIHFYLEIDFLFDIFYHLIQIVVAVVFILAG